MKSINTFDYVPEGGVICLSEGASLIIHFCIEPLNEAAYTCETVTVASRSYNGIVAGIINDRYTSDMVQAISANYLDAKDADSDLTEAKRTEYVAEYTAYQAWRKQAKAVAKEAIAIINS